MATSGMSVLPGQRPASGVRVCGSSAAHRGDRGAVTRPLVSRSFPQIAAGRGRADRIVDGAMAARLGGGAFAQAVAALCAMTAPIYLALFTILSMNAFDVLFWSLAFWMVTKLLLGGDQRMWLLFGLITGIGLQNKTSMVFLGAGLVVVSAHRGPPRCVSDPLVLAGWLAREPVVRPVSLVAGATVGR